MRLNFKVTTIDERSQKLRKNSFILLLCQVVIVAVSFIIVPITLKQLGVAEYGIWITLVGIIEWFNFFDIGLGHGLRNKYAEAKAKNKFEDLKKYVSTTFYMMLLISFSIFVVFLVVTYFLDWSSILNAPKGLSETLKILSIILISMFCIRFVVNLITIILTADQKPAVPAIIIASGSAMSLFIILGLVFYKKVTLLNLGLGMSISQLFPLLIAYVFYFNGTYESLKPKMIYFSKKHLKEIFSFGGQFFLIQITALLLFQSNNIIIAHVCNLKDVTTFNIGMKYFNILNTIFMIMITPLWSATTDAYFRKDIEWLKVTFKKFNLFWIVISCLGIVMFFLSDFAYNIWLGTEVSSDRILMILLLLNVLFLLRSTLYRSFMNGVGKIRLQFLVTFVQAVLHIPLVYYFGKIYGLYGVVSIMFLWNFINSIWEQIQYKKILFNTAKGIWNK